MSRGKNILWLVTDHQLLANRPDVASHLPLQRRLAERGVTFARAYCALPVCSPSRASMLTGLYPHNHGLTENDGRFGGRAGLDPTDKLIHQPFQDAGYRCGWFGKWHLSDHLDASNFGFEGYGPTGYGYPYSAPEYRHYLSRHGLPDPQVTIELPGESGTPEHTQIPLTEQRDWFDYEAGTAILDAPIETHEAFFVADMAKDWLRGLGKDPFFCRVDTWGPHPPYMVGHPFLDLFSDQQATSGNLGFDLMDRPDHHAAYHDYWQDTLVEGADDFELLTRRALQQAAICETALMGVLDTLDELERLDETIVVFCADHGDAVGSNGGVCNKGGLMVEETLHIPLYLSGPGVPNARQATPVCNIDIAPTLADLCNMPWTGKDGQSLRPLFEGDTLDRTGLMTQHYGLATPQKQRACHAGPWKLVLQEDGFAELYNLDTDPFEMTNLARDPTYAKRLKDMRALLADAMSRSNDTDFPKPENSA